MIGNILGNRYRILRELGAGGMAKVYLAEDINEGHMVAVKILYAHFGEDVSYLQRFTREARLASLLHDPHIVKVIDYGSSRDVHYLVMEYVEGKDLRETLTEQGVFSWEEALTLVDQICTALENAHQHNIVHRDIKPQNLMMTDHGLLKVLDFGIARARMLPSLTQSGFVGSPYYIAPEQAMGEDVDIRSDIYSTGIVLYEMLSGKVPFDAKSPWSIISKHISSEPPQITLENKDIHVGVQTLLKRMIAKRPEDRFQTPTMIRQAIAAILNNQEIPDDLGIFTQTNIDPIEMANSLYRRAQTAMGANQWQKAVNLLNQTLNFYPDHPEAAGKLEEAGEQARLKALYDASLRALENRRWQEAIDQLQEIHEVAPTYKDIASLIAKAEESISKETTELQLSQIYNEAVTAFDAGNYTKAENLFGKIKKISPQYKRSEAMWAEARRRTKTGSFSRLSEGLPKKKGNPFPTQWIALTAIVVVTIVALVLIIGQLGSAPENQAASLESLYAQAETAVEENRISEANRLLDEILGRDPENENALRLKETLAQEDVLSNQLSEAMSVIAAKEWTEAIEILENLHDNSGFEQETVAALLCDAYLARGKERLNHIANPRDQATVRAALSDFLAGQQICASHQDLSNQIAFASNYLAALQEDAVLETVISILRPIVKDEPNYAAGQAALNLYQAYLERGQVRESVNDIEGALEDYNAALVLNVTDLSEAQTRQALALQKLVTVATATPTAPPTTEEATPTSETDTPATDTPVEPTDTATTVDSTPTRPTSSGFEYNQPILVSPNHQADFSGSFAEIVLRWEPVDLADNEYYDVTIRYFVGEEPRYWGSGLIKENFWQVPREAGYGVAGKDEFDWWVTVRRSSNPGSGTSDPISPTSEERRFLWRP